MTFEGPSNVFFTVNLPDYPPSLGSFQPIDPRDVLSLSVVEEMGKTVQGSIELKDPSLLYGRILRNNAELNLSWGYKANGVPVQSLFGAGTADIFTQNLERNGLKVLVINPSGGGSTEGLPTFSCNFVSKGWFGSPKFATYDSGTKLSVLQTALRNMGVIDSEMFIFFDNAIDTYSSESVERQCETDFRFVARLASEWRCVFRLGFDQSGGTFAVFCDPKYIISAQEGVKAALGIMWSSASISWKGSDPGDLLAINYDWRNEEGENGEGANVKVSIVNGQPMFQRFTAQGDVVLVETLDTEAVSRYVAAKHSIEPIMNAASFKDPNIQQFWSTAKQTTAPNGLGYSVNVHMFGNPSLTCSQLVTFNRGFPANLRLFSDGAPVQFMIKKVTHTCSAEGYFTDLEVVDLFTVSAVGVY